MIDELRTWRAEAEQNLARAEQALREALAAVPPARQAAEAAVLDYERRCAPFAELRRRNEPLAAVIVSRLDGYRADAERKRGELGLAERRVASARSDVAEARVAISQIDVALAGAEPANATRAAA